MRTVVVGAGAAGLWCALHASDRGPVLIVAPDPTGGSATALAQGGIAAAVAEGDAPAAHAADTITAGAGLSDPAAVRILTAEAPAAIAELRSRGMVFDEGGAPTLEGGHSARRVLHAGGDATGWHILQALLAGTYEDRRVEWRHDRVASLLGEGDTVRGVRTAGGDELEADRVVLATGGATGIFGRRTGPDGNRGHGMALAWDVGAAVADLEFVQFHPTAMDVPGHPPLLLTEALRGEGAILRDRGGHRFMPEFDPRGELAPRDVVARAIATVRQRAGGPVVLDATGIAGVRDRFPTAARSCDEAGLDIAKEPVPVAPAAHYFTGGVLSDVWGRTTVDGLLACGEVACTGVHGANRLASNSLLEALVFGRRAALAGAGPGPRISVRDALEAPPPQGGLPLGEVRSVADRDLGVVRDAAGLERACRALQADGVGERAATLVAWGLARAAGRREESRGGHFRTDFPLALPEWRVRQVLCRDGWATIPLPGTGA